MARPLCGKPGRTGVIERAVLDSVILIDIVNGKLVSKAAADAVEERFISVITRTELLAGAKTLEQEAALLRFLSAFETVDVNPTIADSAATLRRTLRLKTPDALILATARHLGVPLLTRDGDFPDGDDIIRV
jgi:predicted nucleic acid-binding protein